MLWVILSALTRDRFPRVMPTRMLRALSTFVLFCAALTVRTTCAAPPDYPKDVLPILQEHCISCHGDSLQESNLRLDAMSAALRGGDSGEPVIVPGKSDRSYLIQRIASTEPKMRMPPDAPALDDSEIAVLRAWIDAEPLWNDAQKEVDSLKSDHWSFQPPARHPVPSNSQAHPIDAFVEENLQRSGLTFSPKAERAQLVRRLSLVMHGLPPTPDQVERFSIDDRADAWERLVDATLDSPRYGERWASHWLDLIRFGETNGFETNRERPNAYHFRDWVIKALNSDMPYDRFIKAQIAGDVLGDPIGTGFLVAGPNDIVKGQDALLGLMQRQDELSDIVNTVGTAFLGLTTGCARCHNHKFDPITQVDFYALQAVFAGVQHDDRDLPLGSDAQMQLEQQQEQIAQARRELAQIIGVSNLREPVNARRNDEQFEPRAARFIRFMIQATNASEPCIDELQIYSRSENVGLASNGALASSSGDFEHPLHQLSHLNDGVYGNAHSWISSTPNSGWVQIELPQTRIIDHIVWGRDREGKFSDRIATSYSIEASIDATNWQTIASSSDRLPMEGTQSLSNWFDSWKLSTSQVQAAQQALAKLEQLSEQHKRLAATSKVYAGSFSKPPPTHRLYRGDPTAPREEVPAGTIHALGNLNLQSESSEQERRLALASWIARPDNPLTARVMVNRLWQFHFGTGIVDTPSDFGANGTHPSHPELLDWLASEFTNCDWSIKKMHRLILTSHTWQQSSQPRSDGLRIDALSRLLWRFPPRRLEAEAIRDTLLSVSGTLDLTMHGHGFSAFEVELENVRHYFPKQAYGPVDWRRMIYMTKVRQERDSTFGVFDCPDASQVTPKRSRSTTPLQALNLLNGRFVMQQAEMFSLRLMQERSGEKDRIQLAYQLCFSRQPTADELNDAIAFVNEYGWTQFTRAMLNTNESVFIP